MNPDSIPPFKVPGHHHHHHHRPRARARQGAANSLVPAVVLALAPAFITSTAGAAVPLSEYYPVTPNAEWRYAAGTVQVVRRVTATPRTLHGIAASGFRSTINGQFSDTYWWSASNGLRVHQIDEEDAEVAAGIRFQQPLVYTPATLEPGATHTFSTAYGYAASGMAQPFSYDGQIQGSTRIDGPEAVTTAAGTFTCHRVTFEETWFEFGAPVYAGSTTLWLASGVGVVKATDSSGIVLELQSYSIPGGGGPVIASHPASRTVPAGATVSFSVQADGAAPLAYQWRRNGENLPGATQSTLSLTNVSATDAGTYTVEVSNSQGRVVSNPATLTVETVTPPERPRITGVRRLPSGELEATFQAATGRTWQFETSEDLQAWTLLPGVTADGPGSRALGAVTGTAHRFFRLRESTAVPQLTLPTPGQIYEAGTRLGGDLFGFEFRIPTAWRGGLRVNSPWMMFASDTEPGLIVGLLGFSGTREQLVQDPSLRDGFETELDANTKLFFRAVRPAAAVGNNRVSGSYAATGTDGTAYALNLEFLVHPDGGYLGFLALTTQAQIDRLQGQLALFVDSARTPARNTRTDYLQALSGRSFKWESSGNEWYSGNWQGSASSTSWSESYAFFCADGSFEINKESTSYVSSRNSGGWSSQYMSLSYGSSTKEYGQFTVVQDPQHGTLMLIATLAGFQIAPVQLQPNGSLLLGKNQLSPHGTFNCAAP
jgi:hypothetical protein